MTLASAPLPRQATPAPDVARLVRLQQLTAALSEALGVDEVALVVLRHAATLPHVVRGGLALAAAGGRELRFVALHDDTVGADRVPWCRLETTADLPLVESSRHGRPLWFSTLDDLALRYPDLAEHEATFGTRGFATVPLQAAGETLGALMLCYGTDRPFDPAERAFLAAFTEQVAHALRRARAFEQHRTTAEVLQRSLLPATLPELQGLACAAMYEPAEGQHGVEVSGDWYDVLPLDDGAAVVVIGDVMGRGLPAATVMGSVRAALRAYALVDPAPEVVLTRLDRLVATLEVPEQIVTVLVGVVDAERTTATFATAGHVPPVITHPGERAVTVDVPTGPPLGLAVDDRSAVTVPLRGGSTVVLCTDGLVESPQRSAEEGLARISGWLDAHGDALPNPRELAARLVDELVTGAGAALSDDRALLVLASTAGRQVRTEQVEFAPDPRAASEARRWLRVVLDRWSVQPDTVEDAGLCVSELVTNAVIHTGTSPRVVARLDGDRLVVSVSDSGRRGRAHIVEHNLEDVGGRGLTLIEALAEQWGNEQRADGTTVWFQFAVA